MATPDADTDPAPDSALRSGALLALVLAACAVGLVLLERALTPALERQERARRMRPMLELLPPGTHDGDLLAEPLQISDPELLGTERAVPVYRAREGERIRAVLFESVAPAGYGGEIRLLLAVSADGRLLGVRTLAHRETAGLGDMIETGRSDWMLRFDGRTLDDPPLAGWAIHADDGKFDAWSGATVTSRATVTAVRDALRFVERHRAELFGATNER